MLFEHEIDEAMRDAEILQDKYAELRALCEEFVNLTEMIIEDYANVPYEVEDHAYRVNAKYEAWRQDNEQD